MNIIFKNTAKMPLPDLLLLWREYASSIPHPLFWPSALPIPYTNSHSTSAVKRIPIVSRWPWECKAVLESQQQDELRRSSVVADSMSDVPWWG